MEIQHRLFMTATLKMYADDIEDDKKKRIQQVKKNMVILMTILY